MPEQGDFAAECAGDGRRPLIVLWGDSYAASLYGGLDHFASERGFGIAEFTASACAPLIGYVNAQRPLCKTANDATLKHIAELRPEAVVFYGTWRLGEEDVRVGLDRTIPQLKALGVKTILLVGPPATWLGDGLPANLLDYYFQTHSVLPERTWYRSNEAWTKPFDEFLRAQAQRHDISFLSARELMCNPGGCLTRIGLNGSELISFDTGHLTYPASLFLAEHVLTALPGFDR
jgi:hypothetical protein